MPLSLKLLLVLLHDVLSFGIRIAMLISVPKWHPPVTAMAWLLVIFIWPIPGFLFYLMLSSRKLPQKRTQRHEKSIAKLLEEDKTIDMIREYTMPQIPEKLEKFARLGQSLADMPVMGGNKIKTITDTYKLFQNLASDIDRAKDHVHLLYFIINEDEATSCVLQALERAVKRGVACRVLADAIGSKRFLKKTAPRLRKAGITVVEALPPSLFRRFKTNARFDLRNHRKIAVIDGVKAYTGSHNLIEPSYRHKANGLPWRDITLAIEGPVIAQIQRLFVEDWYVETGEFLQETIPQLELDSRDVLIQTVPSGPCYPTENYQRLVAAALHQAQNRIIITTPYLIPDEALLEAMEIAVLGGTKVQLVVPQKPDQFLAGNASKAYYEQILNMGVEIYLYKGGILHAKTMTIDNDLAFFGTSNFDIRSFELNFEINLVLYGEVPLLDIRQIQERYIAYSKKLSIDEWKERPLYEETIQNVTKLFSPLL